MLLASCREEYVLNYKDSKNENVIYCIPSNYTDTLLIQIMQTQNLNSSIDYIKDWKDSISINVTINDKDFSVKDKVEINPENNGSYFYLNKSLKSGDYISLNININDIEYKGNTNIPSPFPFINSKLEYVPRHYNKSLNHYLIVFKDYKEEENFYGIRILRRVTALLEEGEKVFIQPVSLILDDEPLLNNGLGLDNIFDMSNQFFQKIYTFNDRFINGNEYIMHLDFPVYKPDKGILIEKEEYKLFLYSLSKDLYRYIISTNNIYNNDLGNIGLAPIHKRYTNIENGAGFVGGCHIYETEWEKLVK